MPMRSTNLAKNSPERLALRRKLQCIRINELVNTIHNCPI